jgi:predicted nucleic acid-binding protein
MNVVDSSGWLEYFANASNAATLFEVYKRVAQQKGPDDAMAAVGLMTQQGDVIDLTASLALSAAELSWRLKLPMADSIILATAQAYQATLWTQDADFEGMPGVKYVAK